MQRKQSIFASTKQATQAVATGIEQSVYLTVDVITLARNELTHTAKMNGFENSAEYSDAKIERIMSLTTRIAEVQAQADSAVKDLILATLNKELDLVSIS